MRPILAAGLLIEILSLPAMAGVASRVADIYTGPAGSGPSYLTQFGGDLYFRATDAAAGTELWRYDGASVQRVADIAPGAAGSSPAYLAEFGGQLYFQATSPAAGAPRLWRFDGTSATAAPDPGGQNGQNPEDLVAFGGALYYRAFRANIGIELWKFDGASQTPLDLFPGAGSSGPKEFVQYGGQLYLNVLNQELHRLNATGTGVVQVTNIGGGNGGSPEWPAVFGNKIYFSANDFVRGRELWRFDGAAAELAADIVPGGSFSSSNPAELTVFQNALYFTADNGVDGTELWRFDGTAASMVANINPRPQDPGGDPVHHSYPSDLTVFGDRLYFSADDGAHGRELWSFDGVAARLEADVFPGPIGSEAAGLYVYNDRLYFRADDGLLGQELYVFNPVPEPSTLLLALLSAIAVGTSRSSIVARRRGLMRPLCGG